MKVAVFTDIHGNLQALEAILKDIEKENVDRIICLGDVIGIGPEPKECLDLIMNNSIDMVLGNHELYYLKGVLIEDERHYEKRKHYNWIKSILDDKYYQFLKCLPYQIRISNTLFEHFLMHKDDGFTPFYKTTIVDDPKFPKIVSKIDEDYIFVGHEHIPFEFSCNGKTIIDIGSSGCTHDENTTYAIVEISDEIKWHKKNVKYDYPTLKKVLKNKDYPVKEFYDRTFF